MAVTRDVRQNASGGWEVLRETDRRAAIVVETKSQALARARDLVRKEGGGKVRVLDDVDKIEHVSEVDNRANGSHARRAA